MHSPMQIAQKHIDIGLHKSMLSIFKMILLGAFAGVFISFAGIASITASNSIDSASVAKLVGAIVFPAGMAMVLIAGSELFTGNILIVISVYERKVNVFRMLKNWFFVYLGNFIGCLIVALLVTYGHTPDLFGGDLAQSIINAGSARTSMDFMDSFIRGVLCNILVCIAIWMATAAEQVPGKLLVSFWPVMLFVLCGFEHSIADMFFGMCALFTSQEYGITADSLNWGNFIIKCLLPVSLGNIVGGLCVGTGYWYAFLNKTPYVHSASAEQNEKDDIDIAEEY